MGLTPATSKQIPDHAILDYYNKQVYLGNSFSYVLVPTATGTGEAAQILIVNPPVAAQAFPNQSALFVNLRRITAATAADNATLRVYLGPTVSNAGTAAVAQNMRPASATTSVATLTSAPTASSNGTLVETLSTAALTSQESRDLYILDPGKSMLITLQTATSAVNAIKISWYEL